MSDLQDELLAFAHGRAPRLSGECCSTCGQALTTAETALLDADRDFYEHGIPPHTISRAARNGPGY